MITRARQLGEGHPPSPWRGGLDMPAAPSTSVSRLFRVFHFLRTNHESDVVGVVREFFSICRLCRWPHRAGVEGRC
jgi:hypothetical protein